MPLGLNNPHTKKIVLIMGSVFGILLLTYLLASLFSNRKGETLPTSDPQLPDRTQSETASSPATVDPTSDPPSSSTAPTTPSGSPDRTTVGSVPTTPTPKTPVVAHCGFTVIGPAERTPISASGGARFTGTACPGDKIWILDFDPTDGTRGHYFQTNEHPLEISGTGTWAFDNKPIGNEGDEPGTVYPVIVLRGSAECSAALESMPKDSSRTVRFASLPSSCPSSSDSTEFKTVNLVNNGP